MFRQQVLRVHGDVRGNDIHLHDDARDDAHDVRHVLRIRNGRGHRRIRSSNRRSLSLPKGRNRSRNVRSHSPYEQTWHK